MTSSLAIRQQALIDGFNVLNYTSPFNQIIGSLAPASGAVIYVAIGLKAGDSITNIYTATATIGVGTTLARVGLYKKDGTLLASAANNAANMTTLGLSTWGITGGPYVVPTTDLYYIGFLQVGATAAFVASTNSAGALFRALASFGGGSIQIGAETGQADLPSPGTIALPASSATTIAFWAAVN